MCIRDSHVPPRPRVALRCLTWLFHVPPRPRVVLRCLTWLFLVPPRPRVSSRYPPWTPCVTLVSVSNDVPRIAPEASNKWKWHGSCDSICVFIYPGHWKSFMCMIAMWVSSANWTVSFVIWQQWASPRLGLCKKLNVPKASCSAAMLINSRQFSIIKRG